MVLRILKCLSPCGGDPFRQCPKLGPVLCTQRIIVTPQWLRRCNQRMKLLRNYQFEAPSSTLDAEIAQRFNKHAFVTHRYETAPLPRFQPLQGMRCVRACWRLRKSRKILRALSIRTACRQTERGGKRMPPSPHVTSYLVDLNCDERLACECFTVLRGRGSSQA